MKAGTTGQSVWHLNHRGRVVPVPVSIVHTLIIGSGTASLACAGRLYRRGITDILILTDNLLGGTSRNTGSDKQTYFKLADEGKESDSPRDMAQTLSGGGCMHGDIALVEAQNSLNCFYNLVNLGVEFPYNRFGGYTGYRTDHDSRRRGISLGPYTSRTMFEVLLKEARSKNIPIKNHCEVQQVIIHNGRAAGVLVLNNHKLNTESYGLELHLAENVVLGVGGPGGLYETSVYPPVHRGGIGTALLAGAEACNLTESQFGIGSIRFRWNLSGSYQQVLPCYFSTDQEEGDVQYFLNSWFPSMQSLCRAQFLKGYQWPFDPQKVRNYGSSLIDLLVYRERDLKGRRVFMDFRMNPLGNKDLGLFRLEDQSEEVLEYLQSSRVTADRPIDRLAELNQQAVDLYRDHGIDLYKEPLEIAVCAQHNNGGLAADIWWESTNIRHLFPVGEVNGSHGIYRPGGAALNAGQVGALRASIRIAEAYGGFSIDHNSIKSELLETAEEWLSLIEDLLDAKGKKDKVFEYRKEFQRRMTRAGGFVRSLESIGPACAEAWNQFNRFPEVKVPVRELIPYALRSRQLAFTHCLYLEAIRSFLSSGGGSRGSCLVQDPEGVECHPKLGAEWNFRQENLDLKNRIQVLKFTGNNKVAIRFESCRPIPDTNFWFENVWREFQDKKHEREES